MGIRETAMGTFICIRRADGSAFERERVITLLSGRRGFELAGRDGEALVLRWREAPGPSPVLFVASRDRILVRAPDAATLRQMHGLARALDAELANADGTPLAPMPPAPPRRIAAVRIGALGLVILLLALGWLIGASDR